MHLIRRFQWSLPGLLLSSVALGQVCNPVMVPTPGLSVFDNWVLTLHVYDGGTGSDLYAGGWFDNAGAVPVNRIARWNGTEWSPVGATAVPPISGGVGAMTGHKGRLCISVLFPAAGGPCVLEWDGVEWTTLASGKDVRAIASYAGDLFVSGYFSSMGGVSATQIARWDGVAWWPLGAGLSGGFVGSLEVYGSSLIAAGSFTVAGGIASNRIARWDGDWHAMNSTLAMPSVSGLLVHENVLYASGAPMSSTASALVQWDGAMWADVPNPFFFGGALAAWNGDLCAKGLARGSASWARQVVGRWNGNGWTPVLAHAQSANSDILALHEFQGDLYLGGKFTVMAGVQAPYVARFTCVPEICYPDCDASGTLNLADFGCFLSKFAVSDLYADCNRDFALNLGDLGCFQSKFALGCP